MLMAKSIQPLAPVDRLLTAPEVAGRLRLATHSVYALVRRDEIPHLRLGRTVRFRPEAVDEWLREQERGNGRR
jgi:excisionase family DNA binding protein